MITKAMLKEGFNKSLIELIESPNGDGIVCKIGKMWFTFGGNATKELSVEKYKQYIPFDAIIDEIFQALQKLNTNRIHRNEYKYYKGYLACNNIMASEMETRMKKDIHAQMARSVSEEYIDHILNYRDGWTNFTIMDEIMDDVINKVREDQYGCCGPVTIKKSIGKVLMRRLGTEV